MILYFYALTRFWFPDHLAEDGRTHAQEAEEAERGMQHDQIDDSQNWRDKLTSRAGWQAIADSFFMEWKMAYREILFGFTVAGFITVFVPDAFWNDLFITGEGGISSILATVENAMVAPIVAFFTFIGSMGNAPLAALLWSKDVSFSGVMAFLGADLVAATVIWVNVKYYGWRYALVLSGYLYVSTVTAGLSVHTIFGFLKLVPSAHPTLSDQVTFAIDYTFWLNVIFLVVGAVLLGLHIQGRRTTHSPGTGPAPQL